VGGRWENYVVRDVVPWINKNFVTDTEHRTTGRALRRRLRGSTSACAIPDCSTRWKLGRVLSAVLDGPFTHATRAELVVHTPTVLVERRSVRSGAAASGSSSPPARAVTEPASAVDVRLRAAKLSSLRLSHKLWVLPAPRRGLYRAQLPSAIDYASPAG